MNIAIIKGPEGFAVLIDDFRVAGPKPWGGGRIVNEWSPIDERSLEHIRDAAEKALREKREANAAKESTNGKA